MKSTKNILIATVFVFLLNAAPSACTIFFINDNNATVYGRNLDWDKHLPGLVIVNKRGIQKSILHWKGNWPAEDERGKVFWTSTYGSVIFTCYGRDFIEGGMNEAGLIVSEASLTAVYPPDDGRIGLSCTQLLQYQLDNYATVEEVLTHLNDLRPDGEGWHYLIADRSGNSAVIEYLDGTPIIYHGASLEVPALTNTTYRQAMSHISIDKSFGGNVDIASHDDSYGRFVRVAALLRDYNPEHHHVVSDYAFHMLDKVRCEDTWRSAVYDAGKQRVLWKTKNNPQIRWLDLTKLDFSQNTTAQIIDIDTRRAGDITDRLGDYSIEANRGIVKTVLGSALWTENSANELNSRGFTLEQVVEMIATHPTQYQMDEVEM